MSHSTTRSFRRRHASRDVFSPNKDNQQEQTFFGPSSQSNFFSPAKTVLRKCDGCDRDEKLQRAPEKKEEEKLMKKEAGREEEKVQKKESATTASTTSPTTAANYIGSINGKGQTMEAGVQSFYESRIGTDFNDVKIHTGKEAADSAKDINAQAYAYGNHIVFNEGKYQPETSDGKRLLAHELAHVTQNGYGSSRRLNRKPAKEEEVFTETQNDYEAKVREGSYCRDSASSGKLHPGKQCYREMPASSGYPATEQFCFDKKTGVFAESSPDFSTAVNGIEKDGTCKISFIPQPFTLAGRRTAGHFISDVCTEDADMCGGGFGAFAGLVAGIALPKDGLDSPGMGDLLIPAGTAALTAFLLSKGMPVISKFAEKRGFLPSYNLSMGGSEQRFQANLGMGFEKRDKPLPLIPVKTYLTLGVDSGVTLGAGGVGSSITMKMGLRIDPGEQGGLFLSGAVGAGVAFKDDISTFLSKEIGAGIRVTDFMDIEVVNVRDDGENQSTFLLRLNLVAPRKVLDGHSKK